MDTYSIGFLPDDDPVRQDDRSIEAHVGPYLPMELTLESKGSDWRDPGFLTAVEAAQRAVESDPRIGHTTTVVVQFVARDARSVPLDAEDIQVQMLVDNRAIDVEGILQEDSEALSSNRMSAWRT